MPATNPPDPQLVARLGLAVSRLARQLRQQDPTRSGPAASALATIITYGPISLGDLAAAERVSPSAITKIVSRLEEEGSIERVIDPRDRRVHLVQLSEEGRKRTVGYVTRRRAWLAEQLGDLDEQDQQRLLAAVELLERITGTEGVGPRVEVPPS